MKKFLIAATFAALTTVCNAIEPDASHNNPWQSPRWVAPKTVDVWTLVVVWKWPELAIYEYPGFGSLESCEAAMATIKLDGISGFAACVQ